MLLVQRVIEALAFLLFLPRRDGTCAASISRSLKLAAFLLPPALFCLVSMEGVVMEFLSKDEDGEAIRNDEVAEDSSDYGFNWGYAEWAAYVSKGWCGLDEPHVEYDDLRHEHLNNPGLGLGPLVKLWHDIRRAAIHDDD